MDQDSDVERRHDAGVRAFGAKDWVRKLESVSGTALPSMRQRALVYVLLDCSSSMAEAEKMEQARSGVLRYAEGAQKMGYDVGLVKFSCQAERVVRPQKGLRDLRACVGAIEPSGSTNMSAAIEIATESLSGAAGERVICIVTDGMPDDRIAALNARDEAVRRGIAIMVIGTDPADRDFLEQLATTKELCVKVPVNRLENAMLSMVRLLPPAARG